MLYLCKLRINKYLLNCFQPPKGGKGGAKKAPGNNCNLIFFWQIFSVGTITGQVPSSVLLIIIKPCNLGSHLHVKLSFLSQATCPHYVIEKKKKVVYFTFGVLVHKFQNNINYAMLYTLSLQF